MPCIDKNPLIREGTSLLNRVLAALSTGYAKVDEREAADLILFIKKYAGYLNYYNKWNLIEENWESLMKSDVSVALAILTRINIGEISDYKKLLYKKIKLASADAEAKKLFKFLFDLLFSLVTMINEQYNLLPDDFEYKSIIKNIISNSLRMSVVNLQKYFDITKANNWLDYSLLELDNAAPIEVISNKDFNVANLSFEWQGVVADPGITLPAFVDVKSNIVYLTNHNIFNAQVESLLNSAATLVTRANDLFEQTIGEYPTHTPHFALFLAFIEIFSHAQDELNKYTQHHLDFYYKDVLQLTNNEPYADSAFLTFELQKTISDHLLTKNTLFKGGKDITGKEISYSLANDIILNHAAVSSMHSLQIIHGTTNILKAAPIANSDDGQSAKITSVDKSWFTFGDISKIKNAQAGFAIASNILFLNEGTRTVTVTAHFKNAVSDLNIYNLNCFIGQISGKKGWFVVDQLNVKSSAGTTQLIWKFTLTPNDPPIIPYSENIHKQNMDVGLPVLEILLDQTATNFIPYTLLCSKEITTIDISVNVNGARNLMLSNDAGSIDASKPFKPFGDFPGIGTAFYIGSKEIFQKNLSSIDFVFDWKKTTPTLNNVAGYLRKNDWNTDKFTIGSDNSILFSGGNSSFTKAAMDFSKNEELTPTTLEGFIRIKNNNDFSQAKYLDNVKTKINQTTVTKNGDTYSMSVAALPVPDEISLNTMYINYQAQETISFETNAPLDNNLFFHLGQFGYAKVNKSLYDTSSFAEDIASITLFQDIIHDGELFIGFENARENTVVTVLFEVADGSSNPLKDMEELMWYYLSLNNNWKKFEKERIIDGTNNFTQSGIVTLNFPDDIINNNTILEKGLHWIKAVVNRNTDAVCKMILVQAQSARVELVQDNAKQIEFRQILAAGSISKLLVSDAPVKTINQPFNSFDGKIRETDDDYYVRVSERLRHKQRAITIWDYEHIILQKFQKIFKVKCLNQSGFYKKNNDDIFCENYPGHVTIITIPDQKNKTNINRLRPYTPISLLNNINDYMVTITSPFVKLHVKNPQFEEIQLDFKVKFYEHMDESFYTKQLNLDIEQFLCPWAYKDGVEISFDGKVIKSVLLNFVEERPYVDYLSCFQMNQIIKRDKTMIIDAKMGIEEAIPSTARSILVSYYDKETNTRHIIKPLITCDC